MLWFAHTAEPIHWTTADNLKLLGLSLVILTLLWWGLVLVTKISHRPPADKKDNL